MPEMSLRNRLRRPCFSRVSSAVKSRFSIAMARPWRSLIAAFAAAARAQTPAEAERAPD
nr:hypothetical protein [Kutzneria buriramensis]WKX14468.1 hypothetical protein Q4V64_45965 [Kutzneria buriramensis]